MTTHLIGTLMEVKPTEYEDKKTSKITYNTELTVMFNGLDEEGYKKITVETVSMDEEYYNQLSEKVGSTVAIPYLIKVSQYGVSAYADKSMPVLELEKNPLDYTKYERKHQTSKQASKA